MREHELTNEARAVIEAGRGLDNPSPAARERARKLVLARIAAASAVAAIPTGVAAATAPLMKIVLPAVLVVAAGVGGGGLWYRTAHRAEATHPAIATKQPVREPAAVAQAPPAPAMEAPAPIAVTPAPSRAPRAKNAKAKPGVAAHVAPAAAPPGDQLQDETALLAHVNAALRSGDTARGLALLDEYDRRFPRGILHEETTATRIIARCQARNAGAAAAARAFMQAHPRSPLSSRVQSSCLIEPGR